MAETQGGVKKSIIINKKRKKFKTPHHGGAWKVAYADFVTAMMAFFLLMWLLNVTSVEQKKGIANYFSPVTKNNSLPSQREISLEKTEIQTFDPADETELETDNEETRGPEELPLDKVTALNGRKQTIVEKDVKAQDQKSSKTHSEIDIKSQENINNIKEPKNSSVAKKEDSLNSIQHPTSSESAKKPILKKKGLSSIEATGKSNLDIKNPSLSKNNNEKNSAEKEIELKKEAQRLADIQSYEEEKKKFDNIARSLKQAIQDIPELKELAKNLIIEMAEDGMRIQIVDELKKPMFASGSAVMHDYTRKLMERVGKSISIIPNKISISGHTDSVPYKSASGYSNWELSSDRAHATRRTLVNSGIDPKRITSVIGKEDKEPLIKENPTSPENRRISLTILFDKKPPAAQTPNSQKPSQSSVEPLPPVPTFPLPASMDPVVKPLNPPSMATPQPPTSDQSKNIDISEKGNRLYNSSSA